MPKSKPKLKNLYKKSLAFELIKLGHDLHHTMRNRSNEKYQIYVFVETPELIRDMLEINKRNDETYAKLFKK
ncbi:MULTISPECIES: hypothetical protein [unclassified Bacillus cereus group]|uniref:hypothetical protein n=1 Tax=unclassified Bacillus cereus group TaxID=2750818 RepID=UPI0022E4259D|nr:MULTISPECIES: hypothetical protein [unclassified Bacillus cereus group]MDA2216002.1 hypothetical protein [Bacillus cereus group sp. Bc228]MDA2227734.1 hypothetical protein [Bacillus cereus group sp. Bc227]